MDLVVAYPETVPPELARTLDLSGIAWKAVGSVDDMHGHEPADGWAAAVIACDGDPDGAWSMCRALRRRESGHTPVLVLVTGAQMPDLATRHELFDDFCLTPFHPTELEARLRHLLRRAGAPDSGERVEHSGLLLNLETYQASIDGRPLDLTYMEYELLKYLAQNPGRVCTREMLLSRVWGYEYYGGARTVDVHVRRLRAKLGEEHANLIQTVRSVGYRFGLAKWS